MHMEALTAVMVTALRRYESLDSDGDSFTNIEEIKDLRFPGKATSKPQKPVVTAFAIPATSATLVVPITTFTATD